MGQCMTPYLVKHNGDQIPVPCGKCPECIARRISGWSFRLRQQAYDATSIRFITLTYDETHVPITKNGFMTLDKKHLQLFFKKLRNAHRPSRYNGPHKERIKYYLSGEYGGKTWRPHYHVILFNADIDLIEAAWSDDRGVRGSIDYGQPKFEIAAACGYAMKYITKERRVPLHRNDDRLPEFSLMSKGLGKNYLTESVIAFHQSQPTELCYLQVDDKKICMPRYYKNKIYDEVDRDLIATAGRTRFLQDEALAIQNHPQGIEGYERDRQQAIVASYRKQRFQSNKNQKL